MIINGKEILSFKEDTKEDLFYRISVSFDKLYECISEIKDDKVLFLDDLIKEYKGSFEDFYKTLPIFPFIQNDILIYLWLLDKKEDKDDSLRNFLKENKWSESFIDEFNKENFLEFIKKRKRMIKSKVKENDKIYEEIKLLKEQKHTEFKKQRYNIYFLSNFEFSLDYLYNNMKCNKNVPFMSFKNICKIDQSFQYDKDWEESYDNKIILKLHIEKQFITSIISINSNILKFEIIIDYEFKEEIDFRKYIKDIFLIPIKFNDKTAEYDIYGLYYFPNFYFNKYILSHLIMNEPTISKFLSVDESIKASTKKSGILTKYNGGLIDGKEVDVSCNIICKKVDKNDIEIKNLPGHGSYYVRLRLSRFKDMNTILSFISFISKILTIYIEKKDDIFSIYKKYVKLEEEEEEEKEEKEEKKLKNIQPALFVSGYTRKCESKRQPEILDEKDTKDLKEYVDYIQYPEDDYYYHCKNNSTYPNIGLMVNSLTNMNEYPYLPCCYKDNKNNNNNIDLYYFNEEKKEHKQQLVILTLHRLLAKGHYGEIPTNLKQMLSSLFDYSFYRLGVSDTKQSFLECIQKALDKKVSIPSLSIASQENPDLSIEEMEKLYKNKNEYLDPRRWIKLLEHFYKCHIYVFSRKNKDKFVNLVTPFHSGPYLEYNKSYDKTVIILENQDGRTGEYRCELVVKKNNKGKYELFFSEKLPIKKTQFYLTLDKKPIINYFNEPKLSISIKSQVLDSLKKTRCLITTTNVCLLCDPIPPLDLPIEERTDFNSDPKEIEKLKDIDLFPFKTKVESEINNELSNYLKTKKIAFILGEFFIYLFSSFYKKKEEKEENNIIKLIKEFIDEYVLLKNPSYKIIPSSIIDKDIMRKCGYFKNDRIIVKDNETLKRLICLLRLRIMNNLNEVKNYYKSNEFFHFYKDISDFKSNDNILIYNKDLSKIEKYDTTVYYTFQLLPIYYLVIKGKLYISKKIKNEIDISDYFITKYNQELEIIGKIGNSSDKKLTLIEYNKEYNKEYKKEYQQLFLL
jgi:hypothetical protein